MQNELALFESAATYASNAVGTGHTDFVSSSAVNEHVIFAADSAQNLALVMLVDDGAVK